MAIIEITKVPTTHSAYMATVELTDWYLNPRYETFTVMEDYDAEVSAEEVRLMVLEQADPAHLYCWDDAVVTLFFTSLWDNQPGCRAIRFTGSAMTYL